MDVVLIGPNGRPINSPDGRPFSQAAVTTVGHVKTDAQIVNSDGDGVDVTETGSLSVAVKENFETEDTLSEILTQLKIMNTHLSLLTDVQIRKTEVE